MSQYNKKFSSHNSYSYRNNNNFNDYFSRESAFKNCDTNNWILLKSNGLKDWTHWTKKFDENFYYKICEDIMNIN